MDTWDLSLTSKHSLYEHGSAYSRGALNVYLVRVIPYGHPVRMSSIRRNGATTDDIRL